MVCLNLARVRTNLVEHKFAVRKSAAAPPTASLASARDASGDKSPDPSLISPLLRCEWFTPGSSTTGWFFAAYLDKVKVLAYAL